MDIILNDSEKNNLRKLHRQLKDRKSADRIKAILLYNQGYTKRQISEILLLDDDTIRTWLKKFKKSNDVKDYIEDNYVPYSGRLNSCQITELKEYLKENIVSDAKQLVSFIRQKYSLEYSISGARSLLHSLGYTFKQLCLFPSKADIEKQLEFDYNYNKISSNLKSNEQIAFVDAVHPMHNTRPTKAWIKKGVTKYIKSNTGRQRINLNGAYNPITQDTIIMEEETVNAESMLSLFKELENKYATDSVIYVILDNARYNRAKLVQEYVKNSRIQLLYLPPYSPNLNLIERLWKFMRKKVMNTHYYEKFDEFKKAILGFFDKIHEYKNELAKFIGQKLQLYDLNNPKTTLV